ncbi:MAG: glyoxylate/hydroxypyruvate reductase A, partial [Gammaproteobacteria bacterium]|nr:glyoxylate/hydroxypyruvate reductase A [Gammaproteobacteria bacterium]
MTLLFKCDHTDPEPWLAALADQMPEREVRVFPELGAREDIEFALVYDPPPGLLASLPKLKAIFSLWAGIDHLASDPELPALPVVRMVERSMTANMTAYVVHQVLAFHIQSLNYRALQAARHWEQLDLVAPWDRRVGFLGLGSLGGDAAEKLVALRFDVAGWSRTPKQVEGIHCFHGSDGLSAFLARTDILICLMPLTEATQGILNRQLFDQLPRGACVINCARGGHLVEADLVAALDDGQLGAAALDVFAEEPARENVLFGRDDVIATPHLGAATTEAQEKVAVQIAEQ